MKKLMAVMAMMAASVFAQAQAGDPWIPLSQMADGRRIYVANQTTQFGRFSNGAPWACAWEKVTFPDGSFGMARYQVTKGFERVVERQASSTAPPEQCSPETTEWQKVCSFGEKVWTGAMQTAERILKAVLHGFQHHFYKFPKSWVDLRNVVLEHLNHPHLPESSEESDTPDFFETFKEVEVF